MDAIHAIDDGYRPGACNIGPEEIEARRRSGFVGAGVAVVMAAGLVAVGAPPVARWLVVLPAAGAAAGLLQARSRFCAGYGFRGVSGLVGLRRTRPIEDATARALDRRRSLEIGAASLAVGILAAAALVALPV